jgi:uncharacterized membrane protein (UPF0127 family)
MDIEALGPWRIMIATGRSERRRGLLDRDALRPDEALWLSRCRSVHTFGMRFAIDVVLLDGARRPIGLRHMRPGRLLLPRPGVRHIVEVAAGRGDAFGAALAERRPPARR